jgi:hypothetical protein
MDKCVHEKLKKVNEISYHHGLIKILIVEELKKRGDNWDAFLFWNGFASKEDPYKEIPYEPIIIVDHNNKNNHE